jgi:superfamily II DNA/RNA helicase
LVFTNSISAVRHIAQFLQNLGIPVMPLHSNMEQKARLRSVERFSSPSSGSTSVLVATDVAARGLDIKGIDLIAAEGLGVDYDGEEFDQQSGKAKGRGRGGGRHKKEKQAGSIGKAEVGSWRAELKQLLSKRINIGVSERYISAGRIDIDALIQGEGNKSFIGPVDTLDF